MTSIRLFFLLACMLPLLLQGQSVERAEVGVSYLEKNYAELGLTQEDVQDVVITDNYQTKHNGFSHIYYAQTFNGVKVYNALFNVTLNAEGEVIFSGNRFISELSSKVKSAKIGIAPEAAILALTDNLGYQNLAKPVRSATKSAISDRLIFEEADYSTGVMTAEPMYYPTDDGKYTLVWEVFVAERGNSDSWYAHIDANTGEFISKSQNTHYCEVHNGMFANQAKHSCSHNHAHTAAPSETANMASVDGSAYFVVALPAESPIHGPFELLSEPATEAASPFGWHDEDGQEGAEWTITRGNNVHAYTDQDGDNVSDGGEPDGGEDLQFNFQFNTDGEPDVNIDADVVNLFYMNNKMHDIAYLFGFDEPAGSFQVNNYGSAGGDNDPVFAETLDGGGTNNATFSPSPDGIPGRMQMFRWDVSSGLVRVLSPNVIAGEYEDNYPDDPAQAWTLLPPIADVDVTAEVIVVADSDPQNPQQGCGELTNDVDGRIAMIFRGSCEFGRKALNAQEAGAVAAIICNVPGVNGGDGEDAHGMGAGAVGASVTIPISSMRNSDCLRIQAEMNNGPVTMQFRLLDSSGPSQVSSGFDNGIIAHEYGHGIYERLIGGPNNVNCSNGPELLGEGFTDYLSLITTVDPGDTGADARGIGNFAIGADAQRGRGIRRFPYSTDMSVNPQTYADVIGQATHSRGEILVAILWDLHWVFTDLYGYDSDFTNADAGNVRGIQLAFDAMKAVPCNPTFLDVRDAILAIDGGEHACELWDMFARRGMGVDASTGALGDGDDLVESFDGMATCIPTLKINKEVATLIVPGVVTEVTFQIANHTTETATNVIVTDILDDGLTVAEGPAGIDFTQNGNTVIFEIGDMASLEEREFSYQLQTDASIVSERLFINRVETDDEQLQWNADSGNSQTNSNFWRLSADDSNTGVASWFAGEIDQDTDHRLIMENLSLSGVRPVVRFWHRINTDFVTDGGFVEVSTDNVIWDKVNDEFIRGGYDAVLSFGLLAIPSLDGFTGLNPEGSFEDSYLDLSAYNNQDVSVRFRFATQDVDGDGDVTVYPATNGWYIDDFELMDLKSYTTQANIAADNADMVETGITEILINSDFTIATENLEEEVNVTVYPNPVNNTLNVGVLSDKNREAQIQLTSLDGKVLQNHRVDFLKNENVFSVDVSAYQAGMYLVHIISENRITTKKVVVE